MPEESELKVYIDDQTVLFQHNLQLLTRALAGVGRNHTDTK